jgi:aryl-alcohol dehydrogenase-like predicted oxidoreductase
MIKTVLGFGCAPILGRVGKQDSLKALQFAYSEGIHYFDTARSYGWGEAESLLGNFLNHNKIPRQSVEITTKFGLVPKNNKFIRVAKLFARNLISQHPSTHHLVKTAASKVAAPKLEFTVENAKQSLSTSLNCLQTDYIDNILFHEYDFRNQSNSIHEILDFLMFNKKSGIVKNCGFATNQPLSLVHDFVTAKNIKFDVLQIPCSVLSTFDLDLLKALKERGVKIIMHSPFRLESNIFLLYKKLEEQNLLLSLESITGIKIKTVEDLTQIFLSYFCMFYSPYAVVSSMFNTNHLSTNNRTVNYPLISKKKSEEIHTLFSVSASLQYSTQIEGSKSLV